MSNPTLLVAQFDDDPGDFTITGPERYDDGLWLEEGTTNLLANPSFESGITGWNKWISTETFTQDATYAHDGTKSIRVEAASGAGIITPNSTYAAAQNDLITYSCYARGTGTIVPAIMERDSGGSSLATQTGSGRALTTPAANALARESYSVTVGNASAAYIMARITASGGAMDAYFDAFQLEKKPYATSYTAGTRAASSAALDPTGILSPASGALAFRLTPTIETGLEEIWGECGAKGSGTDHLRWGRDATKHPFVEWSSNDAAYQRLTASETIDAGTETFLYFGHAGTTTSLQVDAGTLQTGSRAAVSASFGAGALTLRASSGGNIVSPFATFDQPLDAGYRGMVRDEMAAGGANLWNLLNADGSLSGSMELSHPLSARFALDALLPGTLDLS